MQIRRLPILTMMALLLITGLFATTQPARAQSTKTNQVTVYNTILSKGYNRAFSWSLAKTAATSSLVLQTGQTYQMNYSVTANRSEMDTNIHVNGRIRVVNYTTKTIRVTAVKVVVKAHGIETAASSINCQVTLPVDLRLNEEFTCDYAVTPPDISTGISLATAEANFNGANASGTGTAVLVFDAPDQVLNTSVGVYDDRAGGLLFTATSTDHMPKTVTYSLQIGPYTQCGNQTFTNTAYILSTTTGARLAESAASVAVTVPCAPVKNCTQSQGYWKTHSKYDQHPDRAWTLVVPRGEDSPFFFSGKSWYMVLKTPTRGNPYYILAYQYIAATLNKLQGADTTAIKTELAHAALLFKTYGPTPPVSGALRLDFIRTATTLEKFNTGMIGPGKCK